MAAELGLELAPVELQYTAAFDLGSMSFRVVDPSAAAEDAVHVKAEVCDWKSISLRSLCCCCCCCCCCCFPTSPPLWYF